MAERGWGRIINISSESGEQPDPVAIEYAAAKGALNVLTKGLSKANGDKGVLVNCVSPAYVDTPILRDLLSQMEGAKGLSPDDLATHFMPAFRPNIVLGRPCKPEDVAAAVVSWPRKAPPSSRARTCGSTAVRWRRSDDPGSRLCPGVPETFSGDGRRRQRRSRGLEFCKALSMLQPCVQASRDVAGMVEGLSPFRARGRTWPEHSSSV
jgi:hypothetical protein